MIDFFISFFAGKSRDLWDYSCGSDDQVSEGSLATLSLTLSYPSFPSFPLLPPPSSSFPITSTPTLSSFYLPPPPHPLPFLLPTTHTFYFPSLSSPLPFTSQPSLYPQWSPLQASRYDVLQCISCLVSCHFYFCFVTSIQYGQENTS